MSTERNAQRDSQPSPHDHDHNGSQHSGSGCCGCSEQEVQSLLCQLMDYELTAQQEAEIRKRLCECHDCNDRLASEELIRSLVRKCDSSTAAPEHLRERITVQLRYSETRVWRE